MGKIKYPNVLVVSHNVFSTTSNMGKTMAAFFHGWEKENIAQLFFHTEVPNSEICDRYFRVTDFDILESIFKLKQPGKEYKENDIQTNLISSRVDTGIKSDIYQFGRKRKPYMYIIRNLLWGTNKWKTERLIKWINEFEPDIVFYAAGDYTFSMAIALFICKFKNIPMVVFFGDDYYFLNTCNYSVLNIIQKNSYKKKFKEMFSYMTSFITASDKMQRKYSKKFRKMGYAIMTPTDISSTVSKSKTSRNNVKISYIGNLGFNRWKPLLEIGKCLKRKGLCLDIYSTEKRQNIISNLNFENGIKFHSSISASEVKKVISKSTIIIHVECMDEINRQKTRYSMSTKIAESLGSGVCLFAYGPDDVSSIEYLIENNAACVVTKKDDLQYKLEKILKNENLREKYINNAIKLASKRHNIRTNTQLLYKIITDACLNWKNEE